MACGIAGLSVAADSLSASRYATVRPVRREDGLIVDYRTEGEFPAYGNDDDRADEIAVWLVRTFMDKVRRHETYRGTLSSVRPSTRRSAWTIPAPGWPRRPRSRSAGLAPRSAQPGCTSFDPLASAFPGCSGSVAWRAMILFSGGRAQNRNCR
jgi:Pyruvate formate lyase-like